MTGSLGQAVVVRQVKETQGVTLLQPIHMVLAVEEGLERLEQMRLRVYLVMVAHGLHIVFQEFLPIILVVVEEELRHKEPLLVLVEMAEEGLEVLRKLRVGMVLQIEVEAEVVKKQEGVLVPVLVALVL